MDDDRDSYFLPRLDGFGSASTLNPRPLGDPKPKKARPIGFALPRKGKRRKA